MNAARWRRAAVAVGLGGVAVLALYAVRPGVVENGARSPRVWLVVVAAFLAGRVTTTVLRRVTGRPRIARAAGVLVPVVAGVLLLAPSFQQRELVEPFPVVALEPVAPAAPARTSPAPAAPTPAAATPVAPAAVAPPPVAPPPVATAPAAPRTAEPAPAAPAPVTTAPTRPAAPAPRLLTSGRLEGIGHSARGTSAVYSTGTGTVLRFEDVDIEGTVEPVVYLVPFGARTPRAGVRIGPLKAERGSFGYTLPATVDAERPWTVLVWCAPYDTPIAAADLSRP